MTRTIRFLLLGLMVAGSVSAVTYPKQTKIGKTVIATAPGPWPCNCGPAPK
jgi:hypothetical protein